MEHFPRYQAASVDQVATGSFIALAIDDQNTLGLVGKGQVITISPGRPDFGGRLSMLNFSDLQGPVVLIPSAQIILPGPDYIKFGFNASALPLNAAFSLNGKILIIAAAGGNDHDGRAIDVEFGSFVKADLTFVPYFTS
jgi:hypothetical protein